MERHQIGPCRLSGDTERGVTVCWTGNGLNIALNKPLADLESILKTFLETPFEGGRHQRRIQKIHEAEGK